MLVADETTVAGQIDHETRRSGLDPFVDVQQRGQQELEPPASWGDSHHQADTNGGAHINNEELDVCAEAPGCHSCRRTLRARATMRAAGGCRGRHGGCCAPWHQSSQCHVGLSLPRSHQFGRRPHRTHGHAAVALPWVVLRGAPLHGQAREAPRRTV